jgi:hypothetical protein
MFMFPGFNTFGLRRHLSRRSPVQEKQITITLVLSWPPLSFMQSLTRSRQIVCRFHFFWNGRCGDGLLNSRNRK